MNKNKITIPSYGKVLQKIKAQIQEARHRAVLSTNREMVILYWYIGSTILTEQKRQGWGSKVIEHLSKDLSSEFPHMQGLSSRNLKYMRAFAQGYPNFQFVQQVVAQIPWGHNVRLLDYIKDKNQRLWYAKKILENGWSRDILIHQIESNLYERQAHIDHKTTNYLKVLPRPQSDLAQQTLKDPYIFDFLNLTDKMKEREFENALIKNITQFLLELGAGFSFVGRQYYLEVSGKEFFIDLLFYHLKLRAYVVIELKSGEFKPEYAGQMNFYLSTVDAQLKELRDNPSVGILLCKGKDKLIVEYALRDIKKPIGVSGYQLTKVMPKKYKSQLPSVKDLEKELGRGSLKELTNP